MGLVHPVQSKVLTRKGSEHFKIAVASMQGYRMQHEDCHAIHTTFPNNKNVAMFGVFDGHGGIECAKFCSENVFRYLDEAIVDPSNIDNESIVKSCLDMDKDFVDQRPATTDRVGSTGTIALIETDSSHRVTIVHVGDSRALHFDAANQTFTQLTCDHSPNNFFERKRIFDAGGFVREGRVNGELNMSRAFGDYYLKSNPYLSPREQKLIAIPDIDKSTMLKPGDFLLICCDGIFEKFNSEKVVEIVKRLLNEFGNDPALAMAALLDESLLAGSADNMTAMIITAENGLDYEKDDEFLAGPYYGEGRDVTFASAYFDDAKKSNFTLDQARSQLEENRTSGYYIPLDVSSRRRTKKKLKKDDNLSPKASSSNN